MTVNDGLIREVMRELGRRGRGESKRRTPEQCRAAQKKGVEARLAKKRNLISTNEIKGFNAQKIN